MKRTFEFSTASAIKVLRGERNLSQLDLARRAGMSPAQLCKIERGQNGLTASTLRRLADALGVPVSALLGESPGESGVEEDSVGGRVDLNGQESYIQVFAGDVAAGQVAAEVEKYERSVLEIEDRLGVSSQTTMQLAYAYGSDENAAEVLARDLRVSLGMGSQPRVDLAEVLENVGVRIVGVRRPSVFQSASFYNESRRSLLIALNKSNTAERNAYRLAYELGGAVLFASRGYRPVADEGSCHRFLRAFTAAFLMPEEAVRGAVARFGVRPGGWTMPVLVYVKERFGVSAEAFALRLESLGLIAPSLRHRLRDELRARYAAHPRSMEPHPPKNQTRLDVLEAVAEANGGIKEGMSR